MWATATTTALQQQRLNGHCEPCAAVITDHVLAALDRGVPAPTALSTAFSDLHSKLIATDVAGQIALLFKPTRDKLGMCVCVRVCARVCVCVCVCVCAIAFLLFNFIFLALFSILVQEKTKEKQQRVGRANT